MEEEVGNTAGASLGSISGAVGALFGIAGSLSQAASAKAAIQSPKAKTGQGRPRGKEEASPASGD